MRVLPVCESSLGTIKWACLTVSPKLGNSLERGLKPSRLRPVGRPRACEGVLSVLTRWVRIEERRRRTLNFLSSLSSKKIWLAFLPFSGSALPIWKHFLMFSFGISFSPSCQCQT